MVAVSEDDQLFASYFWWRNYYRATPCKDRHGMEIACHKSTFTEVTTVFVKLILLMVIQAYCKLCARLHQNPPEQKIYEDMKVWWAEGQCSSPN